MGLTYLKFKPFRFTFNEGGCYFVLSILPSSGLPFYLAIYNPFVKDFFRIIVRGKDVDKKRKRILIGHHLLFTKEGKLVF